MYAFVSLASWLNDRVGGRHKKCFVFFCFFSRLEKYVETKRKLKRKGAETKSKEFEKDEKKMRG